MRVVTITTFEDHKSGMGPTAVIELPADTHEDEVYCQWHNRQYETTFTREDLNREQAAGRIENSWSTHEVQTLSRLR